MKENKDIHKVDTLFRQSLEGYSPPPPPGAWKKIKHQLGRGGWSPLWLLKGFNGLIAVSVVLVSAVALFIYNSDSSMTEELPAKPTTAESIIHPIPDSTDGIKQENTTNDIINIESEFPLIAEKQTEQKQQSKTEVKSEAQNTQEVSAGNHTADSKIEQDWNSLSSSDKNLPDVERNGKDETLDFNTVTFNRNSDLPEQVVSEGPEKVNTQEMSYGETSVSSDVLPQENSIPEIVSAENIPGNTQPADSGSSEGSKPTLPAAFAGSKPELTGINPFQYYFGLSGSFGKVMAQGLNPNNVYSVNAVIGITHKKSDFSIETGFGYSYFRDKGAFTFEYFRRDTTGYTGHSLFNATDSSYLIIFTPQTKDTHSFKDTTSQASYTYISIPLHFTRKIVGFSKFNIGIKTGPSLNLLITSREAQPENPMPGANLVSVKNNSYQKLSTSWQWMVAPQLSWNINRRFVFRVEPSAVFYLNNLYKPDNRPSGKPWGIGVRTGFMYNF